MNEGVTLHSENFTPLPPPQKKKYCVCMRMIGSGKKLYLDGRR